MNTLWPHQIQAVEDVQAAISAGHRRILLTSPTGGGKTRMACELIEAWTDAGLKVALYTNRRLLVEQTSRVMSHAGIDHGVRAAGYTDDTPWPVQICSVQTEGSRVLKSQVWDLHHADRILIDEAHMQTGTVMRTLLQAHLRDGAAYVGMTATPIGLAGLYDHLIVAGTKSQLRDCGALLPSLHYGPDEPDLRGIKFPLGEDLTETQNRKAMMRPGLFGRVLEWFDTLNPQRRPTILFAPGVKESIWFAQQFQAAGIAAAHIDGQEVWITGKIERTSRTAREAVLQDSAEGRIVVICNRFVMREGVDAPWIAHCIFGTVFGSLQSYLQSGGRALRSHPSLESVTIQDHGGNWWRHGSLNADRDWNLDWTATIASGMREEGLRNKQHPEPFVCPKCGLILMYHTCRQCDWSAPLGWRKARPVVQSDGTLKLMTGDIFKPRRISTRPDGPKIWERMYHRSRTAKGARTFRAAAALFAQENNWGWPDPHWPLMPRKQLDFFRLVADVPKEDLR